MTDEPIDMSKDERQVVRSQSWPCAGAAELELSVDIGRIEVRLGAADEATVEVRHDPAAGGALGQGISGILGWIGQAGRGASVSRTVTRVDGETVSRGFGHSGFATSSPADAIGQLLGGDTEALAADAVRATTITWSEGGRRLVVRSPQELPLRVVPLAVTVTAPAGSRLAARTGSGEVTVTGTAGWAAVRTGSGRVSLEGVDGDVDVTTGSGDVALGPVAGRCRVRTGSGSVRAAALRGAADVRASSGDVAVTELAADLAVRTGSGRVSVDDARTGRLELTTGSGDLRVGVHPGTAAQLDLTSGSGRARSELDVRSVAPEQAATLTVTGRSGSGDVLVTRAAVPA